MQIFKNVVIQKILNKESGLLGISELSGDNRDLAQSLEDDDEHAEKNAAGHRHRSKSTYGNAWK